VSTTRRVVLMHHMVERWSERYVLKALALDSLHTTALDLLCGTILQLCEAGHQVALRCNVHHSDSVTAFERHGLTPGSEFDHVVLDWRCTTARTGLQDVLKRGFGSSQIVADELVLEPARHARRQSMHAVFALPDVPQHAQVPLTDCAMVPTTIAHQLVLDALHTDPSSERASHA
jgi:hypothetical protein